MNLVEQQNQRREQLRQGAVAVVLITDRTDFRGAPAWPWR
ncbi:hypothetical protein FM125_02455 [Micrococcus lylae]|uniref:Uncharacterized protein n=1 Tax=Micrococcus lylae TaxID=1273 RepID=A0A1R4IHL0_9MICC|nr:hypothetical protein FM125_02455 [Micrococcus lylae]